MCIMLLLGCESILVTQVMSDLRFLWMNAQCVTSRWSKNVMLRCDVINVVRCFY